MVTNLVRKLQRLEHYQNLLLVEDGECLPHHNLTMQVLSLSHSFKDFSVAGLIFGKQ